MYVYMTVIIKVRRPITKKRHLYIPKTVILSKSRLFDYSLGPLM